MAEVWRWLEDAGAHHDVVSWAKPYADGWERAWTECPRGDWLLGIAARAGADPRAMVAAAAACARFALVYLPEDETRPQAGLDAVAAWLEGADDEAARARRVVAVEAAIDGAPDPAVAAASTAALAALRAIGAPEEAAHAATSAVQAAVMDAGDCAMMSAMRHAQAECAELVREHVARPALT